MDIQARQQWIEAATRLMDNQSDINMATIQFNVLMDQIDIAVKALEQLSKLGNGEQLGNSDGNVIAQKALEQMESSQFSI